MDVAIPPMNRLTPISLTNRLTAIPLMMIGLTAIPVALIVRVPAAPRAAIPPNTRNILHAPPVIEDSRTLASRVIQVFRNKTNYKIRLCGSVALGAIYIYLFYLFQDHQICMYVIEKYTNKGSAIIDVSNSDTRLGNYVRSVNPTPPNTSNA